MDRERHRRRPDRQPDAAGLGDGRERVRRHVGEDGEIHVLRLGAVPGGVEASQPEEVLDQAAHAAGFSLHPLEGGLDQATSRGWARAREVWASITESGVRSSWEASAVNSI